MPALCQTLWALSVMSFFSFQLNVGAQPATGDSLGYYTASNILCVSPFTTAPLPARSSGNAGTSARQAVGQGSFGSDSQSAKYNMSWPSWHNFEDFLRSEQDTHSVELRKVKISQGSERYLERVHYVCSRYGTGGKKTCEKKHPEWKRKVGSKLTKCPSLLTVKTYHETSTVLGIYCSEHNHPTGRDNLKYTRISKQTRDWIAGQLRAGVQSKFILERLHSGRTDTIRTGEAHRRRDDYIVLADICCIEKAIEAEHIRLHWDNGRSVFLWADKLREADSLLGFKSVSCPIPEGSRLQSDTFSLMIQTPSQREAFSEHGKNLLCIDGTHNTTMYLNMILTTLLVRDKWGHGIPIAWMLASSGTAETISYFLCLVQARNPLVIPRWIMTDRDLAQIGSCQRIYPESFILLCWWHVLHAWQQHFVISQNEALWEKLKAWIRINCPLKFAQVWQEIRALCLLTFLEYLEMYWLIDEFLKMWSAVYRKNRTVFELTDTNMLVEAWHHVLKGKFLEGRRNHRVDHLVYLLVGAIIQHFTLCQLRQEDGFEGDDIEVQHRCAIVEKSKHITLDNIEVCTDMTYRVKSLSIANHHYDVDLVAYTCTCPAFPTISYCKHICAVQTLFPESDNAIDSDLQNAADDSNEISADNEVDSDTEADTDAFSSPVAALSPAVESHVKTQQRLAIIQQLEQLAACLRLSDDATDEADLDAHFPVCLASKLASIQSRVRVLPAAQRLSPNLKSWPETQAVMLRTMPAKKTTKRRAGDPSYGAGESSGKKVKKLSTESHASSTTTHNRATTSTTPAPPVPVKPLPSIASLPLPQTSAMLPTPLLTVYHPVTPAAVLPMQPQSLITFTRTAGPLPAHHSLASLPALPTPPVPSYYRERTRFY